MPEHIYEPVGSARQVFEDSSPEILLSGPAGTGKSRGCLEKIHVLMKLFPGARSLIARKTAVSLSSTALAMFREFVAKEDLLSGEVKFHGGSSGEPASFRYVNGSVIVIAGLDKATRIMSSEYDVAYIQEAIELTEDDWESISTRLRHGKIPYQQMIADTNPSAPSHWLKQRCDSGRTKIIYCSHEDNPTLYHDDQWTPAGLEYMKRLDGLTGVRYDRLRNGKWSAAEGLVYDLFDARVHLRNNFADSPPMEWERYWSIDFGYKNPTVVQFWARDTDDRVYLFRETYMTGMVPEDTANAIQRMRKNVGANEPDPVAIITDHDAAGREVLERKLGMNTTAAHKSVEEGIEAVQARMRVRGDGTAGLILCRDAVREQDKALLAAKKPISTQEEILEYAWENPVAGKPLKEVPRKINDHGMDAMRYLVAHLDLKNTGLKVRWLG